MYENGVIYMIDYKNNFEYLLKDKEKSPEKRYCLVSGITKVLVLEYWRNKKRLELGF